jgi:hypothetical protein
MRKNILFTFKEYAKENYKIPPKIISNIKKRQLGRRILNSYLSTGSVFLKQIVGCNSC